MSCGSGHDDITTVSSRTSGERMTENDVNVGPFIVFTDLSRNATVLYCSPSFKANTGFEPSELVGRSAFALCHPDDFENLKKLGDANRQSFPVAQMVSLRSRHKNPDIGYPVLDTIINWCYDCLVMVTVRADFQKNGLAWRSSAEQVMNFNENGFLEIENWNHRKTMRDLMARQFELLDEQSVSEPRTVLILDRFGDMATIIFASPALLQVAGCLPSCVCGHSFYNFLTVKELELVRGQLQNAITYDLITRMHFIWQCPSTMEACECEAVITCSYDGLVCVMRKMDSYCSA